MPGGRWEGCLFDFTQKPPPLSSEMQGVGGWPVKVPGIEHSVGKLHKAIKKKKK